MKRLFFAIELSSEVVDRLTDLQDSFSDLLKRGMRVKWTPPENLHITVKFLGSTEEDLVEEVIDLADEVAAANRPFEMTVRGVGAFPKLSYPRILWAGVDEESAAVLADIHRDLEQRLVGEPFHVDEDDHEFTAHVTFGRIKSNRSPNLAKLEGSFSDGPFGTTDVDSLVLYESELSPQGSEYTVLHRAPLGS